MFLETDDFYETDFGFVSKYFAIEDFLKNKRFLVKAHEKNIYELPDNMILAEIHRDNAGTYDFAKKDFLSHKLLNIIFPKNSPKITLQIL